MRRRFSDHVPFGVECALPEPVAPPEASSPQRTTRFGTKLLLVAVALVALLGVWQLGQG